MLAARAEHLSVLIEPALAVGRTSSWTGSWLDARLPGYGRGFPSMRCAEPAISLPVADGPISASSWTYLAISPSDVVQPNRRNCRA